MVNMIDVNWSAIVCNFLDRVNICKMDSTRCSATVIAQLKIQ